MLKITLALSLIICLFSACGGRISTKEETIGAVTGSWENTNLNQSDIKHIVFSTNKDPLGNYVAEALLAKPDIHGQKNELLSWRYVSIGKIEIGDQNGSNWMLPCTLKDNHTLLLNDTTVFDKEK